MILCGGSWSVIRRHELSDAEWEFVRPLLPRSERGRKRLDDRTVLNGIVWKFRTGTAWRDVSERYGSWATLHTRFRRWARDGTFEQMLREAQVRADAAGEVDWLVSVDSTIVRAHQHAAGARKGGSETRSSRNGPTKSATGPGPALTCGGPEAFPV
ncbi:IS5 family transposase [Streptomyces sp. NPDC058240]|uniref:IS5 family transposase n=1 Tax=Streptomyces sp. NPDC058240 TaxID=3346396 RepID=UPI0036EAAA13